MNQLIEQGRSIVQNAPELYIDIDVEADGKPGYGSLLSIGGVTPHGETFYIEMKPGSGLYIPRQRAFCEAHGLQRERLLDEGVDPAEAMQHFKDWTDQQAARIGRKPVFAAFNAGFDFGHIDLELYKARLPNPYGIAPLDLKSQAIDIAPGWDWNLTSKDKLPLEILPEGDFTHNALEDAVYQQHIHFGLAGLKAERLRRLEL